MLDLTSYGGVESWLTRGSSTSCDPGSRTTSVSSLIELLELLLSEYLMISASVSLDIGSSTGKFASFISKYGTSLISHTRTCSIIMSDSFRGIQRYRSLSHAASHYWGHERLIYGVLGNCRFRGHRLRRYSMSSTSQILQCPTGRGGSQQRRYWSKIVSTPSTAGVGPCHGWIDAAISFWNCYMTLWFGSQGPLI